MGTEPSDRRGAPARVELSLSSTSLRPFFFGRGGPKSEQAPRSAIYLRGTGVTPPKPSSRGRVDCHSRQIRPPSHSRNCPPPPPRARATFPRCNRRRGAPKSGRQMRFIVLSAGGGGGDFFPFSSFSSFFLRRSAGPTAEEFFGIARSERSELQANCDFERLKCGRVGRGTRAGARALFWNNRGRLFQGGGLTQHMEALQFERHV